MSSTVWLILTVRCVRRCLAKHPRVTWWVFMRGGPCKENTACNRARHACRCCMSKVQQIICWHLVCADPKNQIAVNWRVRRDQGAPDPVVCCGGHAQALGLGQFGVGRHNPDGGVAGRSFGGRATSGICGRWTKPAKFVVFLKWCCPEMRPVANCGGPDGVDSYDSTDDDSAGQCHAGRS